jgi:hypothetical protein
MALSKALGAGLAAEKELLYHRNRNDKTYFLSFTFLYNFLLTLSLSNQYIKKHEN